MKRYFICAILVLSAATQAYALPPAIPSPVSVPEPATLFLLGIGLAGLWGLRRKMK